MWPLPGRRTAAAVLTLGALLAVITPAGVEASRPRSISPAVAQMALRALDAVTKIDGADDGRAHDRFVPTYTRYVRLRDEAAGLAAVELGLQPALMREAWARTDLDKQTAVLAALTQLGVPYRSHRSEPGVGFDCSGLTTFAWGVAGQQLQRQSRTQIDQARRLDRASAQAGDLVYYPGHVMLFLGVGDAIVHSPFTGSEVEITFLSERRADDVLFGDPTG